MNPTLLEELNFSSAPSFSTINEPTLALKIVKEIVPILFLINLMA
jgi:hypothetical protein